MDGPRVGVVNGGKIIALQEEGYYLKVELTPHTWKLQIDDLRSPKGKLCTHSASIDDPQKILSSPYTKGIRDAYKAIYYENASSYLNETINLIQLYATEFETDEPEPEYKPKNGESKADKLVNLALKQDLTLFRDQFRKEYARIPIKSEASEASEADSLCITPHPTRHTYIGVGGGGYLYENSSTSSTAPLIHKIWPLDSELFKKWLAGLMWESDNEAPKPEHIKSAILVLSAMANEKPVIELHNRVASDGENGILLDMANEKWEAIHITSDGWEIIPQPTTFRRYPHQLPLCYPSDNPDLSKLIKYLNIGCIGDNERHVNEQLLYLIGLITAFINDIPHVGTILYGGAGRSKSVTQIISRNCIDPSSIVYNALPSSSKLTSLIQILDQHYYPVFDNLGDLDDDISDVFCRAITGAAFQLRKLFTDDEAYLRAFKRIVNMNGINIPGEKPDLLDRVLVFETLYIPMSKRRSETELYAEFNQDLPDIMAGILDTLVKALKIYPTIKLERLPRMADFTIWGCAVSEALGIPYKKFVNAYYQNMLNVKSEVVKSRVAGDVLINLLDDVLSEKHPSFRILVSRLHSQLMGRAKQDNIETKALPPDPTRLSRELNIIAENLPSLGYSMVKKPTNKGTELTFSILKNTTLDSTLEDKPEHYHNVWDVSDLSQLLKPSEGTPAAQVKTLETPETIEKQLETIYGYIFDNGPISEKRISRDLKIEIPELRKLLFVLETKRGLIEKIPPDKYKAKEVEP